MEGVNSKRSIAMCLSTRPSNYQQMLHDKIPCNVIYSKPYSTGTLYALSLNKSKTHMTLDNALVDLDSAINMGTGGTGTNFISVSGFLSGKIKTFGSGEHARDEHYRAIFISENPGGGRKLNAFPDVEIWTPLAEEEANAEEDELTMLEDVRIQQQVMRQDPEAFGSRLGVSTSGSKENDMALLSTENTALKTKIKEIESYRANVGAKDKEIEQLKEKLQNNETSRKRMEEQNKCGCQLIQQKDGEIVGLKREVEEYKASGNNKDKDIEIKKLKDENVKLQKEGKTARAENYTLKQQLGSDEHRKSNLVIFQNQLDQARQDGADKLTRLGQEKDAVIRGLKAKIEAIGGGAGIQEAKSLADRNKTLTKQVEELATLKTPGIYEALLAVAKMMGEVNRDSSGAEGQQLKDLTLELVQRTLNGNGYPASAISSHSAPVYAGFFSAYSKAVRTEQESYTQRVSGGMTKRKKM